MLGEVEKYLKYMMLTIIVSLMLVSRTVVDYFPQPLFVNFCDAFETFTRCEIYNNSCTFFLIIFFTLPLSLRRYLFMLHSLEQENWIMARRG